MVTPFLYLSVKLKVTLLLQKYQWWLLRDQMTQLLLLFDYSYHCLLFNGTQRFRLCAVRDCGLLPCPSTSNFERGRMLKYPLKPLLHIAFVSHSNYFPFISSSISWISSWHCPQTVPAVVSSPTSSTVFNPFSFMAFTIALL